MASGRHAAALASVLLLTHLATDARADDLPPPMVPAGADVAAIVGRAGAHAAKLEELLHRGSFTLSGHLEELDGDGKVRGTKELVVRSKATPQERVNDVLRYFEDGVDKTADARKDAAEAAAKGRSKKKKKPRHIPFLTDERARYRFAFVARDPNVPTHVRLGFEPLTASDDTLRGSAWIDEGTGEILSLGFSLSKNPTFVDHVDITVRFDLPTPLGRAPSTIAFDVRGSFLLLKKHYRGSATISDPRVEF